MQKMVDIWVDENTTDQDIADLIQAALEVCYFRDESAARDVEGVKPKKKHVRIHIGKDFK